MTTRAQEAANLATGIGSMLTDVRRQRGMTGLELAFRSGLTASQISRWEHGKVQISVVDLYSLCEALDITIEDFMAEARRRASALAGGFTASSDSSTTPE